MARCIWNVATPITYLRQICIIEVRDIEGVFEGLVDEGGAVVPRHGLLEEKRLGQDLLGAEAARRQLPLHRGEDLEHKVCKE